MWAEQVRVFSALSRDASSVHNEQTGDDRKTKIDLLMFDHGMFV